MNPHITADILVLEEDAMLLLDSEKWFLSLVTMVVGVYSCTGTDHTPWADMDGACVVEDGKAADNHIGFTANGVENCWGED